MAKVEKLCPHPEKDRLIIARAADGFDRAWCCVCGSLARKYDGGWHWVRPARDRDESGKVRS